MYLSFFHKPYGDIGSSDGGKATKNLRNDQGIASVCKQGPLLYHKDGIRIPYKGDFKNNPHTLLLQQEMIREN